MALRSGTEERVAPGKRGLKWWDRRWPKGWPEGWPKGWAKWWAPVTVGAVGMVAALALASTALLGPAGGDGTAGPSAPAAAVSPAEVRPASGREGGPAAGEALAGALPAGAPPAGEELLVSAAASLTDALSQIAKAFEQVRPEVRVLNNFGSSGALVAQIAQGAPVDLFVSAGAGPMENLVSRGMVDPGAVRVVAANRLVLVVPTGQADEQTRRPQPPAEAGDPWRWLLDPAVRRVAAGNPAHVPAGQYARALLSSWGLWEPLQPKLVYGEDVRQVLRYVQRGEVDAGIVYATDALAAGGATVVAAAPVPAPGDGGTAPGDGTSAPGAAVLYLAAPLKNAPHPGAARQWLEFLTGPQGRSVLDSLGFLPPP